MSFDATAVTACAAAWQAVRAVAFSTSLALLLIDAAGPAKSAPADADCAKATDRGACLSELVSDAVEAMNKKLAAISESIKGDDTFAEEFNASQASWENYRDKACEFVWNARDGSPAQVADSEECELILTRERTLLLAKIFPNVR